MSACITLHVLYSYHTRIICTFELHLLMHLLELITKINIIYYA